MTNNGNMEIETVHVNMMQAEMRSRARAYHSAIGSTREKDAKVSFDAASEMFAAVSGIDIKKVKAFFIEYAEEYCG